MMLNKSNAHPATVLRLLALATVLGSLSACSILEGDRIDYKSAGKAPTLEVPPDLTQLSRDSRYVVPGRPVTASGFQAGQAAAAPTTAAQVASVAVGDVRIERSGNQRWLVVNRPADQLWGPVRDFWQENGFLLAVDQSNLGIMETDWAENRAKIPQDIIRSTLGKVFDNLYSTGERDKFRTRLERSGSGGTEIFISHRGMIETYSTKEKDQTVWQPRPADPELEAEFLRRLMVKLGVAQEQSRALVAAGAVKPTSRVTSVNNQPAVQIDEGFDRAWRRVGLALDRTGFTVEDRDRGQGIYFVRYVEPTADRKEPGFFGKLFGASAKENPPVRYRIAVRSAADASTVTVQSAAGAPDSSASAQRILQLIVDELK
jgi:outer membrane protein assembly factor BamC